MAAVAIHPHFQPQPWHATPPRERPHFQYAPPVQKHDASPAIPHRNERELSRDMLIDVLDHCSRHVADAFNNRPVRLVVHGGACMLLHPGLHSLSLQQHKMWPNLPCRTTTRDIDYIRRSFAQEWRPYGIPDAPQRLDKCIRATARQFCLGADWMNSDADVALPMAHDPAGNTYDPICTAALQRNNIDLHTVYTSPNGMLTLISVTPFWSVALKLTRYIKWDPGDICLLLRNGTVLSGTQWTPEGLENWLQVYCAPMGYAAYDSQRKIEMRMRILHAVQLVSTWSSASTVPNTNVSAHNAMGHGAVDGDERNRISSWSPPAANDIVENLTSLPPPASTPPEFPHSPLPNRLKSRSRSRPMFIPPAEDFHSNSGIHIYPTTTPISDIQQPWLSTHTQSIGRIPQTRSRASSTTRRSGERRWEARTPVTGTASWHPGFSPSEDSLVPSVDAFDRSLGALLYSPTHITQMDVRSRTQAPSPRTTMGVVPLTETAWKRTKTREKARMSKWLSHDIYDSDSSSSEEEERDAIKARKRADKRRERKATGFDYMNNDRSITTSMNVGGKFEVGQQINKEPGYGSSTLPPPFAISGPPPVHQFQPQYYQLPSSSAHKFQHTPIMSTNSLGMIF